MNEELFKIVLMLVSILATIITSFIIPFIKEKIGSERLEKYEYWANLCVRAAEMLWKESGKGAEKKQYVVNFLNDMFNKNKVVITDEQIEILIESAVKQLKLEEF